MTDERATLERLRAHEQEYRRRIDEAHQQATDRLAETAATIARLRAAARRATNDEIGRLRADFALQRATITAGSAIHLLRQRARDRREQAIAHALAAIANARR